jgi:ATP-dependent helicase/nuclease subunit A
MADPQDHARRHQWRASDPALSAFVSANAGSGKTHVLVARVVRLMLAGTPPARILCLTFTRAAAAEMAERLFSTLAGWLSLSDDALTGELHGLCGDVRFNERLAEARRLFARAIETPGGLKVQTIHAFCERLLQRFPVEAGVTPGFAVLDETEAAELLTEARDQILAEIFDHHDGGDGALFTMLARHTNGDRLNDLLRELLTSRRAVVAALAAAPDLATRLATPLGARPGDTRAAIEQELHDGCDRQAYRRLLAALEAYPGKENDRRAAGVRELLACKEPAEFLKCMVDLFRTKDGNCRAQLMTARAAAEHPDLLPFLDSEKQRLDDAIVRLNALEVAGASAALLKIAGRIDAVYSAEKRRRQRYDYDDLIALTRQLLDGRMAQFVLYRLDGGIDHILIDEAQDTSADQWEIVSRLTEEFWSGNAATRDPRTIFAVGDPKQSIFSFQGADPALFAAMRDRFAGRAAAARLPLETVPLAVSFRSSPLLLEAVDALLRQADFGDGAVHEARYPEMAGMIELWPVIGPSDRAAATPWEPPTAGQFAETPRLKEACRIALAIRRLIDGGEPLSPGGRPIRYDDILILLRTRTTLMDAIVRSLKAFNIPVAGADRLRLGDHLAVQDLVSLGAHVLLPRDELNLAALLKSPLVARNDGAPIDDDDLIALCAGRGRRNLWIVFRDAATVPGSPYSEALQTLERYRAAARGVPPFDFYARILAGGARQRLMARLGTEAMEPIDEFLNLALAFEANASAPTLAGFLGWFGRAEPEIKRDMDAAHGQVRVMTVHGAKGLEANIVILADTCDLPDPRHEPSILFAGDQGIPLWKLRKTFRVPLIDLLEEEARGRTAGEMKRLLYVALTRARHRLYIAGHCSKAEPDPRTWYCMVKMALAGTFGAIDANCQDALGSPAWRYQASGGPHPGDRPRLTRTGMRAAAPPAWATAAPDLAVRRLLAARPSRLAESIRPDDAGTPEAVAGPRSGRRFARGVLVHRLLELLPPLDQSRRADFALRFLGKHAGDLPAAERQALIAQAIKVLSHPDLAPLFTPDSLAEVPVMAEIPMAGASVRISGQIDRLSVTPTAVFIADYKSDRTPPQTVDGVSKAYLRQLAAYRAALRQIHPDRPVRTALVWTEGPTIMEIPEALLDAALEE